MRGQTPFLFHLSDLELNSGAIIEIGAVLPDIDDKIDRVSSRQCQGAMEKHRRVTVNGCRGKKVPLVNSVRLRREISAIKA